jgi:hypothetical protein
VLDGAIHELIPQIRVIIFELNDLILQLSNAIFVKLLLLQQLREMHRYCVLDLVLGLRQICAIFL